MTEVPVATPSPRKPLRLWPAVVIVAAQWTLRYLVPTFAPEAYMYAVLGGLAGTLLVLVWWLFLSQAPWAERLGALGLMAVGLFVTPFFIDESIQTGMMGLMFYIHVIPVLSLALVAWAVATRHLADGPRRAALVATFVVAFGIFTLLRTDGISSFGTDFAWRWSPTAEDRLLAQDRDEPPPPPPGPAAPEPTPEATEPEETADPATDETPAVATAAPTPDQTGEAAEIESPAPSEVADWPGFRGAARDGHVPGVRIATDWALAPPQELWRRPIGPGWSSFAVDGERLYTQEQRGEDEVVTCYDAATGEPVWRHRDRVRFWEANAGAGPRGTPTLSGDRVYSFGATGLLNVLDAGTGGRIWSADVAADTGVEVPHWGFSSSPLVVDDQVVVAAAGVLAAYDLANGQKRWVGPEGSGSYSSPHLLTLGGVRQIVFMRWAGAIGVDEANGSLLWEHPWPGGSRIVQPALTAEGDLLISAGESQGLRRIGVSRGPDGWAVEERWTTIRLKPYQSDFVVHEGHAYGFDGPIMACVDVEAGERQWKGGRYGNGQLVLLPDQDALLVVTEDGDLALVEARPERFNELARIPAIEGKTWNHPVLVDDVFVARNAQEVVAYRLALAD